MKTYHLEAYKPESSISCRSCTVAHWYGDRELFTGISREDLIRTAAKYMLKPLEKGEDGYDLVVFANGQVYELSEGKWLTYCDEVWDAGSKEEERSILEQQQTRLEVEAIRKEVLELVQAHRVVDALKS